jgi:phosphoribosylglycinamide formyltransferase-1
VRDAIDLGLPYTGVSVHWVVPEVDAGAVVLREPVPIEPEDDEGSLYRRIKVVEHRLLPRAVAAVLQSEVTGGVHA